MVWTVASFFTVGLVIGANRLDLASLLVCMLGYALMTIFFLLMLREVLFAVDDVNKSRRYIKEAVEDLDMEDETKHEAARLLLRDIDNLEPLSGYGLFEMNRSTLTSMISTSITYLIILIQFKQAS